VPLTVQQPSNVDPCDRLATKKGEWHGYVRAGEVDVLPATVRREDILARRDNVDGRAAAGELVLGLRATIDALHAPAS
jgi:hypothetical protein